MSIFTNKTKKNITSVVMTLVMLMVFSASAMAETVTKKIYVLTTDLQSGKNYLIVSRNSSGTGYALKRNNNNTDKDKISVNIKNSQDDNPKMYIDGPVDQNSVFTVGVSGNYYTFKNGDYYLAAELSGFNRILTFATKETTNLIGTITVGIKWTFPNSSQLFYQANQQWHLYYSNNSFDLSYWEKDKKHVYFYEEMELKMTVDETSLSFSTEVGTQVYKSFNVKCENIPININTNIITLSDNSGYFSINPSNVNTSAASSTNGTNVTVFFNPSAPGYYTGTITISSAAGSITVNLNGTANTKIVANPSPLTLTTKVGEPITATFNVKCAYLPNGNNITVTLSDGNGFFSIDHTSVTASAASSNNGETITVTFLPLTTGTFTRTVTLSCNYNYCSPQSVTVSLTGIANTATDYYPVTVSKYGYTTLYFNQALVIPYSAYSGSGNQLEDVSYISAANGSVATTTKLGTLIPANTGVVIKGTADKTFNFPYFKGTAPAAITGNKLTGSMNNISPSDALAGHSGTSIIMTLSPHPDDMDKQSPRIGFYKFVGSTLTGKKAYLIYDTATNNGVNFLSISGMEDEAAGISNVNARIDDGAWYTLQGVRLNGAPKQRGIYIRNGKTVVVK